MNILGRSKAQIAADIAVMLAILAWAWGARGLPDFVLPGPIAVGERLIAMFVTPSFLSHTVSSVWRVLLAVVLALILGGGLALLNRGVPALDWVIRGLTLPFLNSFPSIGWAILAAIWFQPGDFPVVFVQVAILTPFCLINIAEGLRQIDAETMEMAQSFTRNRTRALAMVAAPLLLPYILGSLRIAYGIAWKIALVSELLGGTSGLGYLMLQAQGSADMATVIAACLAIVLLFVAGEKLVLDPLARKFAPKR
jgi:NitT/TauT family transport system permease protein